MQLAPVVVAAAAPAHLVKEIQERTPPQTLPEAMAVKLKQKVAAQEETA